MGSSNGIDVSGLSSQYGRACTLHMHAAHARCTHAARTLHARCTHAARTLHACCTHPAHAHAHAPPTRREQFEYIMQTSQWCQVQGSEIIGGTFEVRGSSPSPRAPCRAPCTQQPSALPCSAPGMRVPCNAPCHAPCHAPRHAPCHAPRHAPCHAPRHAPCHALLGDRLRPRHGRGRAAELHHGAL